MEYKRLQMQILAFSTPDVITTSDTETTGDFGSDNPTGFSNP